MVALVVDVFDQQAELLVDVAVAAGVGVDLVQPAHALGQVAAALLEEGGAVVVVLLGELEGRVGVDDAGELVAVRGFPLRQDDEVVLAGLQAEEQVQRFGVAVLAFDPSAIAVELLLQQDHSHPNVLVDETALLVKALLFLADGDGDSASFGQP